MSKDRYAISSLNPHTHAGCDTVMGEDVSQRDCFNPHTHAGCDFTIVKISGILLVSIHTPTQGVTCQRLEYSGMALFQSTHPRRVWHSLNAKWEKGGSFNPHTHAGCDEEIWRRLYVQSCFNPHTHAGCDQKKWTVLTIKNSFNPHTHAGCDHGRLYAICQLILFQSTHPRRVWLYI